MVREVVSWEQSFKVRRRRWCAVVKTKNLNITQIFNYFQFFHFFLFNRDLNRGCLVYMFSLRF